LTSDRKIKANRANARASTGPRTTRGRARAARNALRHALSLPVCSIPALSEEVETLAGEIAGSGANAETQELARLVAEAQIDLHRVRYARHQFLSDTLSKEYYDSYANMRMKLKVLRALLRPNPPDMSKETLEFATSKPQGAEKLATILSGEAKKLLAMDRYERRALARRKFAIRAFDAARARTATTRGNVLVKACSPAQWLTKVCNGASEQTQIRDGAESGGRKA
jgi:hypothetical protein